MIIKFSGTNKFGDFSIEISGHKGKPLKAGYWANDNYQQQINLTKNQAIAMFKLLGKALENEENFD